ncbi:MAG: head-tail connector protein [Alphaproteobacteria bacterium]
MPEPLRLTLTAPPSVEPVTIAEAKAFLRVDISDDDALIAALVTAAREACERFTGRALVMQTWTLFRDGWPGRAAIEIPRPPLLSIVHVKIYDDTDTATLWPAGSYFVDTASEPGRLIARNGAVLPSATRTAAGIEIRFVAGYAPDESASPSDVTGNIPGDLVEGIRRLVAYLYENRGECGADEMAALSGATLLWRPYRVMKL